MSVSLQVMDYESNLQDIADVEQEINLAVSSLKQKLDILKKKDELMRERIIEAMKREGIKKYESDFITLTYVAPSERTTLNTKLLKEEMPGVYVKYSRTSPVKESLRIKVRENE